MSMSVFQQVSANNPKKQKFDLSHTVDMDCKIGAVYPFLMEEMVPGDVGKLSNSIKVNFQPTKAPILDYIEVKADYFFCPNRIVWNRELGDDSSWEDFITQVPTGDDGQTIPEFSVPMIKWNPVSTALHSMWDYFGFPVGRKPKGKALPTSLGLRSVNMIANEYYRDENLQEERDLEDESTIWANAAKDYLTSAFTSRQRGSRIGLPVNSHFSTTSLPFSVKIVDKTTLELKNQGSVPSIAVQNTSGNVSYKLDPSLSFPVLKEFSMTDPNLIGYGGGASTAGNSYVSISPSLAGVEISSSSFDITDLRLAFQIQKWQERSLRGGERYTEFLHSFFGVSPRDDRLQRPEYIGGTRSPVISSTVISKGVGSDGDETIPLGSYAGYLISADGGNVGSYRAKEYGWLIGLLRIVPKVKYTDGINRMFLRNTPFDYYFPEFSHLSEQGIYNEEVFVTDNDEETNLSIWGYQGMYNELRHRSSRVVGALRSENDFLFWSMARKFASLPNLNGNFISYQYMQDDIMRIFAVTDPDVTYPAIVHVKNYLEMYRPMPYIPIPR